MLTREQGLRRNAVEILCKEDGIPKEHLPRKIGQAVDFYNGRTSIGSAV